MSDREYARYRLNEVTALCRQHFNLDLAIVEVIFDDIETGQDASCLLFRTSTDLYALFNGPNEQTLADVKRQAKNVGIVSKGYAYPYSDKHYFVRHGRQAFLRAYPGRSEWTSQEARYYMTIAPYPIGLIRVASIDSELRRFIASEKRWGKAYDYSYKQGQSL